MALYDTRKELSDDMVRFLAVTGCLQPRTLLSSSLAVAFINAPEFQRSILIRPPITKCPSRDIAIQSKSWPLQTHVCADGTLSFMESSNLNGILSELRVISGAIVEVL